MSDNTLPCVARNILPLRTLELQPSAFDLCKERIIELRKAFPSGRHFGKVPSKLKRDGRHMYMSKRSKTY